MQVRNEFHCADSFFDYSIMGGVFFFFLKSLNSHEFFPNVSVISEAPIPPPLHHQSEPSPEY